MKQLNLNQLYQVYGGVNNAASNSSSSGSDNNEGNTLERLSAEIQK